MRWYDPIARLYDPWSRSVTEDVPFYLEEARRSGGPVVELGVGTGRIAVPIASDGIRVIGVDSSRAMLDVCAERAALAGAAVDLRLGDLREPPVEERVPLVICPFRSLLHMETDDDRRRALRAVRRLLEPGGRFVFDVFAPSQEDIVETNGRWLDASPDLRAGRLGRARAHADALGARRRQRVHDAARVARAEGVGSASPRRGIRGRGVLRVVRPASLLERRGHDLGRLAVLTALAALALPATAAAASAALTVPAAHVRFTLEPNGVVDVLEEIELRAKGPFATRGASSRCSRASSSQTRPSS